MQPGAEQACRCSPAGTATRSVRRHVAPAEADGAGVRRGRAEAVRRSADAVLKAYPASTDAEALESAASLASDLFIGYATWKWIEMHLSTGQAPVYRYSFDRKIPADPASK